ncbi:MAG: PaaI family thioesterase [Burkholderiaceae bacterium]|nr:PaaI family thioesterase [Burkholderiaceae bacterium]
MGVDFPLQIPFVQAMGFELLRMQGGEAEIGLTLRPDQHNSLNMAHGGVTMTLLDVAMAHAARSADAPVAANAGSANGRGVVTIEMKTSFMRPGTGRLTARARVMTRTIALAFCEASLFDEAGALVAHATGSFKYLTRGASEGRRVRGAGGD